MWYKTATTICRGTPTTRCEFVVRPSRASERNVPSNELDPKLYLSVPNDSGLESRSTNQKLQDVDHDGDANER